MIEITVNDNKIIFAYAECVKSIGSGSGGFSFLVGGESNYQIEDNIKILIDKNQVINGKIEKITDIENEKEQHKFYIGRDYTGDIIDSTFDKVIEFNKEQSLVSILNQIIASFDLTVESEIEDIVFSANELPTAQVGENIFNYCNHLCTIRNVILTVSNTGTLLLTKRGINKTNDLLKLGKTGNIIAKEFSYDSTLEFDKYKVYSQNNSTLDDLNNLVNNTGIIGEGKRVKSFIEYNSLTPAECTKRAEFEKELDFRKSWSYIATLPRHIQSNGEIWDKNLVGKLEDIKASLDLNVVIRSAMWVQSDSEEKTILTLERSLDD